MKSEDAVDMFSALAHADRLTIISQLVAAGPKGMAAGDIAAAVGASASRASFHLSALHAAGILQRQREARVLRYSVDFARIGALMTWLMRDCCKNSPELRACCGLGAGSASCTCG